MIRKVLFVLAVALSSSIFLEAMAQDRILIAQRGGVKAWSVPEPPPADGHFATKIVLESEPGTRLVTFGDIEITNAHQVWSTLIPDSSFEPKPGPLFSCGWVPFDSHLLISQQMIAGGVFRIVEDNDKSLGSGLFPSLPTTAAPQVGIGRIGTSLPTDAFFLKPEYQSNMIDFARVVSIDQKSSLTVGVLGEGFVNSGEPGGAFF